MFLKNIEVNYHTFKSSIKKYYNSSEDKWFIDDYKKHVKYFEEIIRYGQMKGKIYKSISFSYIPVLRELEENK